MRAIDYLPKEALTVRLPQVRRLANEYHTDWACAHAHFWDARKTASSLNRDRCYIWFRALGPLLNRKNPKTKGTNRKPFDTISMRYDLLRRGDYFTLVALLRQAYEQKMKGERNGSRKKKKMTKTRKERVMYLVKRGLLSMALRTSRAKGQGDLKDEKVAKQIKKKLCNKQQKVLPGFCHSPSVGRR